MRLDNLSLFLRLYRVTRAYDSEKKQAVEQPDVSEANLATSLDAREGQKVVVGKSNVRGTDDAIILVITPRVIE